MKKLLAWIVLIPVGAPFLVLLLLGWLCVLILDVISWAFDVAVGESDVSIDVRRILK